MTAKVLSPGWLGLVLLTLVAFSGAAHNGVIWDDDAYLTDDKLAGAPGLLKIWLVPTTTEHPYYPLTHTMFWLENRWWGHHPAGYHIVNVLLHTANAALVYFILKSLQIPGAWFCAAVFAVHPVQAASVAQIAERKNVLAGLFYFASLLSFLKFDFPSGAGPQGNARERPNLYRLSVVLFVFSLLSKTAYCTLPLTLLVLIWWRNGRLTRRDLHKVVPYVLAAVLLGALTVLLEKDHLGAKGPDFAFNPIERALIAGRALIFYAGKILWPRELLFIYPRWTIDAGAWWQYLYPLSVVAALGLLWLLQKKTGRGVLACVLMFIGNLLPALGFINFYRMIFSFVADHFVYVSILGLIVLYISVGRWLLARRKFQDPGLLATIGALILAALALRTWQQVGIYRDELTFYSVTIKNNPQCWMAYNNRGRHLEDRGDYDEAFADYQKAWETNPACQIGNGNYSCMKVLNNLGNIHSRRQEWDRARDQYDKALKIEPLYSQALLNRGGVYFQQGRFDLALADFDQALKVDPHYVKGYMNRGLLYLKSNRLELALSDFSRAIALAPKNKKPYLNRAVVLMRMGRPDAAVADLNRALTLDPAYGEAYLNRAVVCLNKREYSQALADARKAQALGIDVDPALLEQVTSAAQLSENNSLDTPGGMP